MTGPTLTIANEKESEFEFDVSISGVPAHEANVRFVLEGGAYDTTIQCNHNQGSKRWLARIPAMKLDESAKNFRIEVIAGGYYFCPTQGSVKITHSPRVQIAEMLQKIEEPKAVSVSANFTQVEATPAPKMVMLESMTPSAREGLFKRCQAASQILFRAANIMKLPVTEQKKMTSKALVEVLEAVEKAVKMVKVKVYI